MCAHVSASSYLWNRYARRPMVAFASPIWTLDDGEAFLLAVAANVPEWQRDGLCAEYPGEWWFPERVRPGMRSRELEKCAGSVSCKPSVWRLRSTSSPSSLAYGVAPTTKNG
jgi:hypothetical protein